MQASEEDLTQAAVSRDQPCLCFVCPRLMSEYQPANQCAVRAEQSDFGGAKPAPRT